MTFSSTFALLLLGSPAFAFPWAMPGAMDGLLKRSDVQEEILTKLKERFVPMQSREVKGVMDPVLGLIPTNEAVEGLMRFPEAAYPFQAPGPTDQRGPCPGLNVLANHGYIPRNGIATLGQIADGAGRLYNMSPELSALIAAGGVLQGDIVSQKMSIGGPDGRVSILDGVLTPILGTPPGIAGHGKFTESDASGTRNDLYLGGDNMSFQPELFQQLHQRALELANGTYTVHVVQEHFKRRYADSKARNPKLYFNPPAALKSMGANYFVPAFFCNGSYVDGTGIPNEASITSFFGAQPTRPGASSDPDLTYTRVPERIPPGGWYRRRTPMGIVEAGGGILDIYLYALPQFGGNDANGAFVAGPVMIPTTPQGLACFFYTAIYANFPSNALSSNLIVDFQHFLDQVLDPGSNALSCDVEVPGTTGSNPPYSVWSETYVGKAKENAVGSGWYHS